MEKSADLTTSATHVPPPAPAPLRHPNNSSYVVPSAPYVCRTGYRWSATVLLAGVALAANKVVGKPFRGVLITKAHAQVAMVACLVGACVLFLWNQIIGKRVHAAAHTNPGDYLSFVKTYGWGFDRLTKTEKQSLQAKYLLQTATKLSAAELKKDPAFSLFRIAADCSTQLSKARVAYFSNPTVVSAGFAGFEDLGETEYLLESDRIELKHALILNDVRRFLDGLINLRTLLAQSAGKSRDISTGIKHFLNVIATNEFPSKEFNEYCASLTKKDVVGISEEQLGQLNIELKGPAETVAKFIAWEKQLVQNATETQLQEFHSSSPQEASRLFLEVANAAITLEELVNARYYKYLDATKKEELQKKLQPNIPEAVRPAVDDSKGASASRTPPPTPAPPPRGPLSLDITPDNSLSRIGAPKPEPSSTISLQPTSATAASVASTSPAPTPASSLSTSAAPSSYAAAAAASFSTRGARGLTTEARKDLLDKLASIAPSASSSEETMEQSKKLFSTLFAHHPEMVLAIKKTGADPITYQSYLDHFSAKGSAEIQAFLKQEQEVYTQVKNLSQYCPLVITQKIDTAIKDYTALFNFSHENLVTCFYKDITQILNKRAEPSSALKAAFDAQQASLSFSSPTQRAGKFMLLIGTRWPKRFLTDASSTPVEQKSDGKDSSEDSGKRRSKGSGKK